MLARLFPRQIDNAYRGHWLAIWILALVVLLKAVQGVESILNTRSTMENADGLSLANFDPTGAALLLSLFALLGLYFLIVPALSALALIRYRAMIPLIYLILLLLYGASRLVQLLHPVPRADAHPIGFYVNLVILGLTVLGLPAVADEPASLEQGRLSAVPWEVVRETASQAFAEDRRGAGTWFRTRSRRARGLPRRRSPMSSS